ncbi:polysaccharide deacetylase family protein [Tropicibacter naphthalenivorans]|uniref:Chitooligosaccharide deacetylase n=1 Tax=Tropicibacter naphthalenivorans TaxID=441103 RepID=A0A0N7M0J9_9RHOB|nr:polysaccharide deacetylase family protein [Tropicibacter naphthalenivorans]CUH80673.1 putative urate catabolism protein [Tropicibacter naphthalenivorans]SMC89267.1 Polysaccharide deacetylase [Tropicibacter naphthalenivorans]
MMTSQPSPDAFDALVRTAQFQRTRRIQIPDFAYPEGVKLAVNFTLDFDAMLLRRLLNEPWGQKAKGEFGGRVGVWRIMEMFDAEDVKVTLFTPGRICELYPEVLRAVIQNGHELGNHMWEHEVYADPVIEDAHLTRTLKALSAIQGGPVTGTRSSHTPGLLRSKGVVYNSFTSAHDLPFYELDAQGENPILQLPFHYALDDAMYFSFGWLDTPNAAQRVMDVDEVFDIWWAAFEQQYKAGGYVNFLLHPFVSGHAMRVDIIQRLIQRIKTLPGVWFPTCDTLAQHILTHHPLPEAQ